MRVTIRLPIDASNPNDSAKALKFVKKLVSTTPVARLWKLLIYNPFTECIGDSFKIVVIICHITQGINVAAIPAE